MATLTEPLPLGELAAQLRSLGLAEGSVVMVHASLRKLGPVEGRAQGVIDALRGVLGPSGTLVMLLAADDDFPFDSIKTPTDPAETSVLAEILRLQPEVHVNDHPAARFAAIGRDTALIEDPPLHDYYGPGSPLEKLTAAGAKVLRLGSNIDTVTLTHWAEYLAGLPSKRRVTRRYVRADSGVQYIDSLDDTDGIATWSGGDYFSQILIDFIEAGLAHVGQVGQCTAELFDAETFVPFAVMWMETNLG